MIEEAPDVFEADTDSPTAHLYKGFRVVFVLHVKTAYPWPCLNSWKDQKTSDAHFTVKQLFTVLYSCRLEGGVSVFVIDSSDSGFSTQKRCKI